MNGHLQKWWSNALLIFAVTFTIFLAFNVLIDNIFGSLYDDEVITLGLAAGLAPVFMLIICLVTDLGKEVVDSFKRIRS